MSLATTPAPAKQFSLGLLVSRSFDNPEFLHELLAPNLAAIGHLYLHGARPGSQFVESFAHENKIGYTVYPASDHAFKAVARILEASEFVYIVTDGESKLAKHAEEECVRLKRKYKVVGYNPCGHWKDAAHKAAEGAVKSDSAAAALREKVGKAAEIAQVVVDAPEFPESLKGQFKSLQKTLKL